MKKYTALSLCLLSAPSLLSVAEPILIKSPIVQATDGLLPMIKLVLLLERVKELLVYNYGKGDHQITIKDIAENENHFDQARHEKLLTGCLNNILFILTQEPNPKDSYLRDFRFIQQQLEELILAWADQRGCPDTPLKALISLCSQVGKEQEVIVKHFPTLTLYHTLLVDAEIFLTDLLHSYPKSYAMYRSSAKGS